MSATLESQRFPGVYRLKVRKQYRQVYDRGRRVRCRNFTLFGLPNDLGHSRLGVTATRKTGNAVVRNRTKRLLREIFRRQFRTLEPPVDLVVNVHRTMLERPFEELEKEFVSGFGRLVREMSR